MLRRRLLSGRSRDGTGGYRVTIVGLHLDVVVVASVGLVLGCLVVAGFALWLVGGETEERRRT
jgi:hypothetical protein